MNYSSPRDVPPLRVRYWPLVAIVLVGGGMLYAVQIEGFSILRPSRDFMIVGGLINFCLYIWVRAWSGLQKTAQIATVAFVLAMQVALLLTFRFDEFAGDGRILFRRRWMPTPEQRLADFSSKTNEPVALANLTEIGEQDSPAFRGADRTGRYRIPESRLNWIEQAPRELWRRPVGLGWSSFAVVGEYCVTQEQRGSDEAVVCYELRTGNEVWRHLDESRFDEATSGAGPRATPTICAGRVYSFGATGRLNCLDGKNGRVIWSRQISDEHPPLFGYSCSPLIHGKRVYITPGDNAGSLTALDADTGEIAWSRNSRKAGYSSPHLFPTRNEDQILVFDAIGLHGHDSVTGDRRWNFRWGDNSDEQVNVCQPVILPIPANDPGEQAEAHRLLISSGYGRGSALISVTRAASGEWAANAMWQSKSLKSKFSNVIVQERHAYGLDDGILTCISLTDGTRRWKNGRYGFGQLILVNQILLIQTEPGRIVLVKADPNKFTEVATLDALHERTWNQPVIAGMHLLVRSDREAVCFELPSVTSKPGLR